MLAVLSVVYGDIGTSPLYALRASLLHFADDGLERWEVLGILSLIVWSVILVVTVKYVLLILRADNRGECGILALMALAQRQLGSERAKWIAGLVGVAGACLFFGDGIITPAISVLSAVEGLKVVSPTFEAAVVPLSLVILVVLFLVQYRGTGAVGALFGPVCAVWFLVIGGLGVAEILRQPGILAALSPSYAVGFAATYHLAAFVALSSVFLVVTGAEALYADMGHFGRRPIARMWILFVLPALTLNYLGQGALLLSDPATLENPFYLLAPEWLRIPLVFLATAATMIASQAVISGAYSVGRQCIQLGFLPRLTVRHTSGTEAGQIYMPQVNFALLAGVIFLVLTFRTSDGLAAAYGIAVTGTGSVAEFAVGYERR
jgi:KUP system potassium uptake protein